MKNKIFLGEEKKNDTQEYMEENKEESIKEESISPFKIYENQYCDKCEDYMGCLGLIDSTTMALQDSNVSTGNEAFDSMVKSMGGLTFSARFKMILDCAQLRNMVSKTDH